MFADKEYYVNVFCGEANEKLPAENVVMYLRKASTFLNSLFVTKKPEEPYDECIKNACCEIAECFFQADSRAGIASESNDGYSVTYTSESAQGSASATAYTIAQRNLAHTGLLYRGIG
ncbi:MAG: hypothetical protein J6B23_04345 [Clostridia bacterium]|nr:hypothetical protein [Clostridia bacterium]